MRDMVMWDIFSRLRKAINSDINLACSVDHRWRDKLELCDWMTLTLSCQLARYVSKPI